MTEFNPARPRYTLPFAGTEYELLGTFGLIEAVEYATKTFIGVVAVRVVNGLPAHELAVVISTMLTHCGHKVTAQDAKAALWDVVGLESDENQVLRFHIYSFLKICLAPPGEREQRKNEMGKLMGKLTDASPGPTTAASA